VTIRALERENSGKGREKEEGRIILRYYQRRVVEGGLVDGGRWKKEKNALGQCLPQSVTGINII
jgi:hypothetical protein